MQPWYISHAETIAQNVVGQLIAFIVLRLYGVEMGTGLQLQLTFLIVAYARGYAIRRAFAWWEGRRPKTTRENTTWDSQGPT